MNQNTIAWGVTQMTFTKEEFDYIYDIVELPSRRDLVCAFDTVFNWEGLGKSMKEHPEHLLRWINKIACAIEVVGRSRQSVFESIWPKQPSQYDHLTITIPNE